MNKKIVNFLLSLGICFSLTILPGFVLAQGGNPNPGGGITNPLGGTTTFQGILVNIIRWLLGLVALLALLSLIVGGVRVITSFGDESKVSSGKKIIYWAVIGLAVVMSAYAIINIVVFDILGAASE